MFVLGSRLEMVGNRHAGACPENVNLVAVLVT